MGSAIPIKLPENAFSHFGESVVSRRILRFLSRILRAKKKMVAPKYCEGRQSEDPCQTDKRGRASHKNEEEPPLYKPQSAQGTGKQETASF